MKVVEFDCPAGGQSAKFKWVTWFFAAVQKFSKRKMEPRIIARITKIKVVLWWIRPGSGRARISHFLLIISVHHNTSYRVVRLLLSVWCFSVSSGRKQRRRRQIAWLLIFNRQREKKSCRVIMTNQLAPPITPFNRTAAAAATTGDTTCDHEGRKEERGVQNTAGKLWRCNQI